MNLATFSARIVLPLRILYIVFNALNFEVVVSVSWLLVVYSYIIGLLFSFSDTLNLVRVLSGDGFSYFAVLYICRISTYVLC